MYGDTEEWKKGCHRGIENKDEISLRGLMCERQVGQEGSTPPQSSPATGQGETLRRISEQWEHCSGVYGHAPTTSPCPLSDLGRVLPVPADPGAEQAGSARQS